MFKFDFKKMLNFNEKYINEEVVCPASDIYASDIASIVSDIVDEYKKQYGVKTETVTIKDKDGNIKFQGEDIEMPKDWPSNAAKIFASKYLLKNPDGTLLEDSFFDVFVRVITWLAINGVRGGYFSYAGLNLDTALMNVNEFIARMIDIVANRRGIFNSPVLFNAGVYDPYDPIISAGCFVLDLQDNMESIVSIGNLQQLIALNGAGSGVDLTTLRSSREKITGGGTSSGPVSFLRGWDVLIGGIKSGGKHRRAAASCNMKETHPDIMSYIKIKSNEEKKARVLKEHLEEWDDSFGSEGQFGVYGSLAFQNFNPAVRLTEEFWDAHKTTGKYWTKHVKDNIDCEEIETKELLKAIATSAYECGDPGIAYDDNINDWNPLLSLGKEYRCNNVNACFEIHWINNGSCNLAVLRLTAYYNPETNVFNYEQYKQDINIMIIAQDIICGFSAYPTEEIAEVAHYTRNIGLGFTDLGELLFLRGLPYDSDEGRKFAAGLASYLTCVAYDTSRVMAGKLGVFKLCKEKVVNKGMEDLIFKHRGHAPAATCNIWDNLLHHISYDFPGFRNAQVTVMAPYGTTGPAIGSKTTSTEPHFSHIVTKSLVGGGSLNQDSDEQSWRYAIKNYLDRNKDSGIGSVDEGVAVINHVFNDLNAYTVCPSNSGLFDLFATANGTNGWDILSWKAHVDMMAAIQPNISAGISKTCNVPNDITIDEIVKIYEYAHDKGIKAIAIYRDGSKVSQPLNSKKTIDTIRFTKGGTVPGYGATVLTPGEQYLPKELIDKSVFDSNEMYLLRENMKFDSKLKPKSTMLYKSNCDAPRPSRVPSVRYKVTVGDRKLFVIFGWHPDTGKLYEIFASSTDIGGEAFGNIVLNAIQASRRMHHDDLEGVISDYSQMIFPPSGFVQFDGYDGESMFEFSGIKMCKSIPHLIAQMLNVLRDIDYNKLIGLYPAYKVIVPEKKGLRGSSEDDPIYDDYAGFGNKLCPECSRGMIKSGATCWRCPECGDTTGSCG